MITTWIAPVVALIVSAGLVALLTRVGNGIALDIPNERSLHDRPVPRSGGIAIVIGIMAAWLIPGVSPNLEIWIALIVLAGISLADDIGGISILLRLSAHLAAAAIVLAHSSVDWGQAITLILVLGVVWVINLYNFMDGSDGLAGGMALFGFGSYSLAAWIGGDTTLAVECAAIAAAAAGFLPFNFHPARIFMGDVGSIPLGFLAAILGVQGWQTGTWPLWFPLLVFSPFLVDATVTLVRRALHRQKVWDAHRDHYYQRLVRMGWSHGRLALCEYALMAGTGFSAVLMLDLAAPIQWAAMVVWSTIYLVSMAATDSHWRQSKLH